MKKILVVLILVMLSGALWSNRGELSWFLQEQNGLRTGKPRFETYRNNRLQIYFVPSKYFSRHLSSIASDLTESLERAEQQLSAGARMNSPLTVYLYNDWEEKGNHVKEITIAHADPKKNILYCVVNEDFDGTREKLEYQLALRMKYGHGVSADWERYITAALAGVWNQKKLEEWAEFFLPRNLYPEFPDYWKEPNRFSNYLVHAWSAIFARHIRDKYGFESLIDLYRTGEPPKEYESTWSDFLRSVKYDKRPEPRPFRHEFQKGISYAYSNGYDAGYATKKSNDSLTELQKHHVNSIAAIPYGFMRGRNSPVIRFAGNHIATESDESVIALSKELRRRGLKLMLKPQIWIAHDSWPGNINFEDQAGWNQWFTSYERWILHYAILAEQVGADIFCIGTELVQSTLKQPDLWKALIKRIRDIYDGPLVYAANHGPEFEGITFWNDLDYIGLDNYYSVRIKVGDGTAEMKKGFQIQKQKIQNIVKRYNKPVLFTEIGYRANVAAGMGSQEYNFSKYNDQIQAECYRLAFETYWNEPWFSGMYFWKWFSDPGDRGRNADSHSPHGRPAALIMAQWYQKSR